MKAQGMFLLALGAAQASVLVIMDTESGVIELGPYRSTRFSKFIGSFDSNCSFNSTAVFLDADASQSPCDKDSVEVDLNGSIVMVSDLPKYGCFEETIYTNLESLGAVAVLNTDRQPPGSTMYMLNFGKKIGSGTIPFLDLGLDFFMDVMEPAVFSGASVTVVLDGCSDRNPFTPCVEVVAPILSGLVSVILFYMCFLAGNSALSLPKTAGTLPRIYVLWCLALSSLVIGILQLFNFVYIDSYIWIMDGKVYSGLQRLGTGSVMALSYNAVILCAYYWLYLEGRCFQYRRMEGDNWKENLCILNNRKSFFERIEFKLVNFVSFCLLLFTSVSTIQVDADFTLLGQYFFGFDLVLSICLVITNYRFVKKTTETVRLGSGDMSSYLANHESSGTCQSVIDNLTGRLLKAYLRDTQSLPSEMSRSTLHLILHLGYWLHFFAISVVLLSVVQFFLAIPITTVGRHEDDRIMDTCGYLIPPWLIMVLESVIFYPLIQGIKGPSQTLQDSDRKGTQQVRSPKNNLLSVIPRSSGNTMGVSIHGLETPPGSFVSTPGISKLRHVNA